MIAENPAGEQKTVKSKINKPAEFATAAQSLGAAIHFLARQNTTGKFALPVAQVSTASDH